MKLENFDVFSKKSPDIECHENPSCDSRVVPCGRTDEKTDMTKLIVAFRNFANATNITGELRERKLQKAGGN